ncbi:hypothetical protein BME96_08895 [Virgibacillus halodenitrificans]|uniref:Uncharacterized protein n=1 Tax=Virgibacillus halodenitrificans TaxID=1482 RepID=A0AAC9NKQ9_VIRHA|nr:hypothetical protein BME96_08895 [Virgibacillus halodenitrificans]
MSISIDGKKYLNNFEVKYGDPFPVPRRSMRLINPNYGTCLVYVISTGVPKWTNKMTVHVPMKYYITQIVEPNKKYRNHQKRNKLQLIKGGSND